MPFCGEKIVRITFSERYGLDHAKTEISVTLTLQPTLEATDPVVIVLEGNLASEDVSRLNQAAVQSDRSPMRFQNL